MFHRMHQWKSLTICQYLAKIWTKLCGLLFWATLYMVQKFIECFGLSGAIILIASQLTDASSGLQICQNCSCGWDSAPDPDGKPQCSPDPLGLFGSHVGTKGRVGTLKREIWREGTRGRKRGREGMREKKKREIWKVIEKVEPLVLKFLYLLLWLWKLQWRIVCFVCS